MIIEKEFKITNRLGLHARAAALFVKTAGRFASEVTIKKGKLEANGKSILGVLTLAAACGSKLKIACEGDDAQESLEALQVLIEAKFNEE